MNKELLNIFNQNKDMSNMQPIRLGPEGFATYQLISGVSLAETYDLIENLYAASYFGWFTIFVNKQNRISGGGDWKPNVWINSINNINI